VAFRKHKKSRKFVAPVLMLTSMMDMFTIILIFLVFSFSESTEKLKLDHDLELPNSTAKAEYQKAVKLVLSKKELRLNDEVMAAVQGGQIVGLASDDLKSSALYQRLKTYRAEIKEANKAADAPHVLFLCDKSHSFKTINSVMKTAGLAGYPNFQFAVLEGVQE